MNRDYWLGILAALLASVGDILLLYHPEGGYHEGNYLFLMEIPLDRMAWGHYLGVLFIPLELFGLWRVAQAFRPLGKGAIRWAFGCMVFVISIGAAYHGMLWFVAHYLQNSAFMQESVDGLRLLFEPLSVLMAFSFLIMAGVFNQLVWQRRLLFPRWLFWWNPIFSYLLFLLLYLFVPVLGNVLMVAGFNLAIALFLFQAWRASRPPQIPKEWE